MTVHLEQLADEAILMRADYARPTGYPQGDLRTALRRRLALEWATFYPALATLADQREAALSQLYTEGITPNLDCTETVGAVTITTHRLPAPLGHVHTLHFDTAAVAVPAGRAWLCTTNELAGPGRYVAILDRPNGAYLMAFGDDLSYAVYRVAALADLNASKAIREAAERGEIQ